LIRTRYPTYKQALKLVDAHRVQPAEQVRASSIAQRILDSIKTLCGRCFQAGKP